MTWPPTTTVPAWMQRAACNRADLRPDLWFPSPGRRDLAKAAVAVCRTCPVIAECGAYADAEGIPHGVWGGRWRGRERHE